MGLLIAAYRNYSNANYFLPGLPGDITGCGETA
ncbi:hypothetical protein ECIG_01984 [Escherichia coli M605]|uniref:Uncharacterized protein n=1 Tax=Escherichia coli M605 TaxID=656417 RepID=F4T0M1_ECOLX|nr:hypothetical protein ECIG_01984 [Escherichia coli M605]